MDRPPAPAREGVIDRGDARPRLGFPRRDLRRAGDGRLLLTCCPRRLAPRRPDRRRDAAAPRLPAGHHDDLRSASSPARSAPRSPPAPSAPRCARSASSATGCCCGASPSSWRSPRSLIYVPALQRPARHRRARPATDLLLVAPVPVHRLGRRRAPALGCHGVVSGNLGSRARRARSEHPGGRRTQPDDR